MHLSVAMNIKPRAKQICSAGLDHLGIGRISLVLDDPAWIVSQEPTLIQP
jgi:hypothetical protein